MMLCRVVVSDALELMRSQPDGSVDLLLTDIPYGEVSRHTGYVGGALRVGGMRNFNKGAADAETFAVADFISEALRVTKGSGVIFCAREQVSEICRALHGVTTRTLVWEKANPFPLHGERMYLSGVELAVYFRQPKAPFYSHCKNPVFRYPCGSSDRHPTEKPLGLFKELIADLTAPGDLVMDPCVGSGTTVRACEMLGRRFIGGDINPDYVAMAQQRQLGLGNITAHERLSVTGGTSRREYQPPQDNCDDAI